MSTEYNNKHINIICPECKSTDILVDDFHQETYCTGCGLILKDNHSIFQVTRAINHENNQIKIIRDLWKKKKKKKRK